MEYNNKLFVAAVSAIAVIGVVLVIKKTPLFDNVTGEDFK
tara:strand:- start:319 stop:438 length:120 start_codon:yes stop_codon:yes gene_type:complete